MSSKDLTAILFVENQGRFAHPSVKSVEAALEQAVAERGISTQFVLLADAPDEPTRAYLEDNRPDGAEVLVTSFNSRTRSLEHALNLVEGTFVALSRAHDLVSGNWLSLAYEVCVASRQPSIAHPATIISFGERTLLYIMPDQLNPDFSIDVLLAQNPWPGPFFGAREIFLQNPIREPDESRGFGKGDWLWICDTVANGVVHRPVAETFSCCHRRWGHACVAGDKDASSLMPSSSLFKQATAGERSTAGSRAATGERSTAGDRSTTVRPTAGDR